MRKIIMLIILSAHVIGIAYAETSFGNPNGSVVLEEYFDYNCPVCRAYAPVIDHLAKINPSLKVIQRVVPVLSPNSFIVDSAVLASFSQSKFYTMQRAILHVNNPETISSADVMSIAKHLDLNLTKLKHDMHSKFISRQLQANLSAYLKLHTRQIPIVIVFSAHNPNIKKIFIGAYPFHVLQNAINQLKQNIKS